MLLNNIFHIFIAYLLSWALLGSGTLIAKLRIRYDSTYHIVPIDSTY